MMESIMLVASSSSPIPSKISVGPRDTALRAGRTCYDHLAGRLGVALADALVMGGHVELKDDVGLVTNGGMALFDEIGIDMGALLARRVKRSKRVLCRPCLDWSERRPHLAGVVGAELCAHSFTNGWIHRIDGTRAVTVTPKGRSVFREKLGMRLE